MEASMVKPGVKKKPKPPKPPPKPPEIKRHESGTVENPTPVVPQRPTDAELTHTQYRMKRSSKEVKENLEHETREKRKSETPVVPPRPTEKELNAPKKYSYRNREKPEDTRASIETDQAVEAEASTDEADFKQANSSALTGMFRKSQKEKLTSFTSYVIDSNEEGKTDDTPVKQAPANKQGVLKGVMKGLQFKSSPKTSREPSPDPRSVEPGTEKEEPLEKNKQPKNAEPKQDKGGLFTGMFKKTHKEKSSSLLTVTKADNDPEDTQEQTSDEGSVGDVSACRKLSGSSDSLSANTKEKTGLFSGMFKKPPKTAGAVLADEEQQSLHGDLSNSADNLCGNSKEKGGVYGGKFKKSPKPSERSELEEEKGGLFSGLLKKTPKTPGEGNMPEKNSLSVSNDSLSDAGNSKDRGGVFTGMFKKLSKLADDPSTEGEKQLTDDELSIGSESVSEDKAKEKGGIFGGIFKKPPKPAEATQTEEDDLNKELSTSSENLSESKQEKGAIFGVRLKKTPKTSGENTELPDRETQKDLSASTEDVAQSNGTKEKNIFSNLFKKPHKSPEDTAADKELEDDNESQLSGSNENIVEATAPKEKKGGLAAIFKRSASTENVLDNEEDFDKELSTSRENLFVNKQEKNIFSNLFKKPHKSAGDATEDKELEENSGNELSRSNENITEATAPKEKKGGLAGIFKRSASTENLLNSEDKNIFSGMFKKTSKPSDEKSANEDSNAGGTKMLSSSCENLSVATSKEKTGGLAGIFRKSPKPAPRTVTSKDPLSDANVLYGSCDSIPDIGKEDLSGGEELSGSNENLFEATKEKKNVFSGMFRRTPKTVEKQDGEDMEPPEGGGLRRRTTIKKKRRVVSFRVKKTLPRIPKLNLTSQSAEKIPIIEESVELLELIPEQESTVELQNVEMAAYPTEGNPLDSEEENDGLLDWWNSVEGWAEWNESSNFQEQDEETAMEQAADRIYMAARLFVRLFNQRGASLQQRILELLSLADAADQFHKKTVTAAVGGGVASVCGSVATITGLILAPFTFGASIIVTAVGIGVATAGSITSATANITDTVHSNMDRKKVEKMIQGYQEEIKDIRECLEFVQEGMDTLQELDFDKYSQSAAKKALNHNIKHVMKEGGRAGKALMINTDKLISTVQVLGAAGGAAKAAQAISVTTGVMSALFLALDVFFLAKDSHELRKGAKTKFATKIREVCKDLQDGLLELNKVKTQLQKTMDGIELEEYEEIEEVEVEVDEDLESDPVKLAELEQELDIMEEKLDKKIEEEKKAEEERKRAEEEEKNEEAEKANKTDGEKSVKDKGESDEKTETRGNDVEKEGDDSQEEESEEASKAETKISDEEKQQNILTSKAAKEVLKEQSHKGSKKDKEMENQIAAGKDKYYQGNVPNKKNEEVNTSGKEQLQSKSHSGDSKGVEWNKMTSSEKVKSESETNKSSREDERGTRVKHELKPEKKEPELESKRGSRRRDKDKASDRSPRRSKHEPRAEEDRGVKDWRVDMMRSKEEKREKEGREPKSEMGSSKVSHRSHEKSLTSSREESDTKRRGHEERGSRVKEEEEERSSKREEPDTKWRGPEERGSRVKDEEERRKRKEESDAKRSHSRRGHDERGSRVKDEEDRREESEAKRTHSRRGKDEGSIRLKDEEQRREESETKRSHSRRGLEERENRVKHEREDGESWRSHRERRESDRDRGHGHSRRGSRSRANALLDDGLYI